MTRNLRETATILVMIFAVLLAVFFSGETWLNNRISRIKIQQDTAQRNVLLRLIARAEPELFFTRKILPLLRIISENNPELDKIRENYLEQFGLELCFYCFDQKGNLSKKSPSNAPNLWLMRNLYPALAENSADKLPALAKQLDKKIQFAFGYGKDLVSLREKPEKLIETFYNDQAGLLAYTVRENKGTIIFCPWIPSKSRIFQKIAYRTRKQKGLNKAGIIQLNKTPSDKHSLKAHKAFKHLRSTGQNSGFFANQTWHFIRGISGSQYFASFSINTNWFEILLMLFKTLIILTTIAAVYFFLFSKSPPSLKFLLICMFFAASLIPLGGIAVTAIDNLEVFQDIETNRIRAAQEETLGNIAQNFSAYLASCSAALTRLTSNPGESSTDKNTRLMKNTILSIFSEARITIYNSAGERNFYHGPIQSEGRITLMKSIVRKTIERYAPERLDEHKYSGNPFSDQIVGKDDMGFGTVLNHPEKLQMLNTGNSEFLLFYRLLPSDQGDAAVVMVELSISNSIKRYLENYKNKRLTAEQCILTLAAFSPKEYRWALPPKYSAEQKLLQLAENVWATNQPIFKVDNETLKGFALGTRPNALSGVCLLAFSSNEKVQSTLSKMKKRIVIGALIAFILLTSVAIWISRQLISPLGFLSKGVEALAARKFETRLPEPPGNDEIAQLFKAFNNMMAESYDMQIAHNVQEGLLPQNFPEIEGFSVHGFLREASELGGDCLDCFMLNDKKLFFLVGDITGHGVGSALIMAFSRAITFHWSQQDKDLLPASLADHIDGMLRKNRTERMFMGIICGTLDIENQCIELVVKGHIYPLHLKADGTSNWVGLPAYPLGIAKQTPAKSIVFSFNPGDKLLCMTDGILEARAQNKVLGFNGIEEWAEQTRSANAKEWIKQIEVLYSNWTNTTQHDDISIFALCNNRDKK